MKKTAKIVLWPLVAVRRKIRGNRYRLRRSVLENLGRMAVEDPVLRVKEFGGSFALDARSNLFARVVMEGEYEPDLAALCASCLDPERDFIDVGTNVGFFTVLAASRLKGGRVLSVEPMPNSLGRLRRNIEMNGVGEKVEIFEGAVSDHIGTTRISYIEGKEEFSSIVNLEHPAVAGEEVRERETPISTLDHLVSERKLRPGLVKVDAEGSEALVFRGAEATLREHRPKILSELSDYLLRRNGSSAREVVEFIRGLGYVICNPETGTPEGLELGFGEILCIPEEEYGSGKFRVPNRA